MQPDGPALTHSLPTRVLHLALASGMIEPLRRLLEDIIADAGARFNLASRPAACDVVMVMVHFGDERHVIADARAMAGDVPLLAILPFADEGLARRVLLAGAQGWFALDTPLSQLSGALVELAGPAAPDGDQAP